MFEFRGDWFNASAITCIEVQDEDVRVHVYNREDPFIYSCDDDDDAIKEQAVAVAAWRKALNAQS